MTDRFGLRAYSVPDLLLLFASVLGELRQRGVIRSTNNPVADYSEWLVSRALGLDLVAASAAGYDAVAPDGTRYQIKGRRITPDNPSRQLSAFRGFASVDVEPFDYLAGVLFNFDFTVYRAALVPVAVVREQSTWQPHVNAWRFRLRDAIWNLPGVVDITEQVRAVTAPEAEPRSPSR